MVAQDELVTAHELVRTQQLLRRHLPLPPPRSLMSGVVTGFNPDGSWSKCETVLTLGHVVKC